MKTLNVLFLTIFISAFCKGADREEIKENTQATKESTFECARRNIKHLANEITKCTEKSSQLIINRCVYSAISNFHVQDIKCDELEGNGNKKQ